MDVDFIENSSSGMETIELIEDNNFSNLNAVQKFIIKSVEKTVNFALSSFASDADTGKLKEIIINQSNEIADLKQELAVYKENAPIQAISNFNIAEYNQLLFEFRTLKDAVEILKKGIDIKVFNLRNIFSEEILFANSNLILDTVSAEITGEILNEVFMSQLKSNLNTYKDGYINYKMPERTINQELSLVQWITLPTGKFDIKDSQGKSLAGYPKDNTFDTSNPREGKVSLGTGTGKSTHFLRCLAHGGKDNKKWGATLVVPFSSLVPAVLDSHNNWLSDKDSKEERVINCLVCGGSHLSYETIGNAESKLINVFSWWEFLEALIYSPDIIKPWVVFDEAHTDMPAYRNLIDGIEKMPRNRRPNNFGLVQMSATFSDLPTSRRLSGTITDLYTTNFVNLLNSSDDNRKIFEKTTIVFVDDIKQINLSPLDKNGIKYLILTDSIKDYASDIVRSTKPPFLVFANRDYSVGFSFGDVNVISTGISTRIITTEIKEINVNGLKKLRMVEESIKGVSNFADLLQERGRSARDEKYTGVWMSLISKDGYYSKKQLDSDILGQIVLNFFNKTKADDKGKEYIRLISETLSKNKPVSSDLNDEEGRLNLNKIFSRNLTNTIKYLNGYLFDKDKLEKENKIIREKNKKLSIKKLERKPWEYVFTNNLVSKFFNESDLFNIIIESTKENIDDYCKIFSWFDTKDDLDDDYIFESDTDANLVSYYMSLRENFTIDKERIKFNEIRIQFKPFKFESKKASKSI